MTPRGVGAILLAAFLLVSLTSAAETFAQTGWRGDGTGRTPKATPPITWSANENVLWKQPLEVWSNASPVLFLGRIFLCQEQATLLCLDAADGKILWQAKNDYAEIMSPDRAATTPFPPTHGDNGFSSPTPVCHEKAVYVLFGTGVAAAYDMKGKRIWARFVDRPVNGWGHSASPVIADGKLILHIASTVHALDPKTGNTVWTAPSGSNWGTPLVLSIGEDKAVLTTGGDIILCRDGKTLASGVGSLPWTSPIVNEGIIYIVDESGAWAFKLPAKVTTPLPLEKLWEMGPPRDRYYASPLVHKGLLYAITQSSQFSVIDAATGAMVYSQRLPLGGTAYPSICLAGDKLFVSSDSGQTLVLEPGREYKELAANTLEPFRTTPLFTASRIYIRTFTGLFCLGKKEDRRSSAGFSSTPPPAPYTISSD